MDRLPILSLENVGFETAFGGALLRDISFNLYPGDRTVLIGPSGAGKTTLLHLLNRLCEPTQGVISFQNQPYTNIPILSLRRSCVLVLQEPKLLGMRVKEALTYPLILQQLPPKEVKQRLEQYCQICNIPLEWLERTELQLSQGQRQLVAIARSLMMTPQILLLDEPTSALDFGTAQNLLNNFQKLTDESKITILMVNHQLELVEEFANHFLYLENGQLLADRPASQIDWEQWKQRLIEAQNQP